MPASTPLDITTDQWAAADDHAALLAEALLRAHAPPDALAERLRQHVPDFWRAYAAVYGTAYEQLDWVADAFDVLLDRFGNRPEPLRALDADRAADPDWYQDGRMIGVMLYVDQFAGTLAGVRERIPYLQELGITYVHLMPLLKTREGRNDGGYAVQDYYAVDPSLGSMDDLRTLARDLHEEDMVLAVDLVMNHTAREHDWAQAALTGDARYQDFYLMFDDRTLPDQYEQTLPEVFPDFAPGNFTYVDAIDQWVWTSFYDFQWDLNYANPEVFVRMLDVMLHLANTGADVLRLDAVPFLWKRLGTNCRNLEEAHELLRAYRALVHIAAPGVLFKAEAIVEPSEIIRYLGTGGFEGKECEIAYNAALMCHLWHALASENTQLLHTMLGHLPEAPDRAAWLNYVRAHDDIGWGLDDADVRHVGQDPGDTRRFCADFFAGKHPDSYAEGYHFQVDEPTGEARTSGTTAALAGLQQAQIEGPPDAIDAAVRRILMMHSIVFAAKGIPLLYSGDEIGQLNDFSYLAEPLKAIDNRWVHRPPMDWDKADLRRTEGSVEHRLFRGLQQLAEARNTAAALHGTSPERVRRTTNDALFVLERGDGADRLLAAANFAGTAQALPLAELPPAWHGASFTDLLTGDPLRCASERLLLPPYGYRWLTPAPNASPGAPVETPIALEVETEWGEEVYLVGDVDALGAGDPQAAHGPLSAADYPTWRTTIRVPAGTQFTFRWIKKRGSRIVEWSSATYGMEAGAPALWPLSE